MKRFLVIVVALVSVIGFSSCSGLKDGTYTATGKDFDAHGFKPEVSVTVSEGKVSAVLIEELAEDGSKKSTLSREGIYDMSVAGAQWPWHEQAQKAADYLVENQGSSISTFEAGKTDAISGCTIAVEEYFALYDEAVKKSKN